jgi:hypothetical protein
MWGCICVCVYSCESVLHLPRHQCADRRACCCLHRPPPLKDPTANQSQGNSHSKPLCEDMLMCHQHDSKEHGFLPPLLIRSREPICLAGNGEIMALDRDVAAGEMLCTKLYSPAACAQVIVHKARSPCRRCFLACPLRSSAILHQLKACLHSGSLASLSQLCVYISLTRSVSTSPSPALCLHLPHPLCVYISLTSSGSATALHAPRGLPHEVELALNGPAQLAHLAQASLPWHCRIAQSHHRGRAWPAPLHLHAPAAQNNTLLHAQ